MTRPIDEIIASERARLAKQWRRPRFGKWLLVAIAIDFLLSAILALWVMS